MICRIEINHGCKAFTRPSFCGEKSKNMRIQTKNNSQKIVKYLKLPAKIWAGAQIYYSLTFI